jgi:site-specific recombinase XerD
VREQVPWNDCILGMDSISTTAAYDAVADAKTLHAVTNRHNRAR